MAAEEPVGRVRLGHARAKRLGRRSVLAVRRHSLEDQVTERLRELILDGTLPPGTPLIQSELAEELRVSRTPVRDALSALEKEGLVHVTDANRAQVIELGEDEFRELFEVRAALEGLAARLAASRLQRPDVSALEALAEQTVATSQPFDAKRYMTAHSRFHVQLIVESGNSQLIRLLPIIHVGSLILQALPVMTPADMHEAARGHLAIVGAIASGKPDEAERLARGHLSPNWKEETASHPVPVGVSPTASVEGRVPRLARSRTASP